MKHLIYTLSFFAFCLLFTACKKQSQPTPAPDIFVPGRILVGIKEGVPVQSVFALADSQHLNILFLSYYTYVSFLPADSLASISTSILGKSYINQKVFDFVYKNDTFYIPQWAEVKKDTVKKDIVVDCTLLNMDIAAQTDWISTLLKFNLTDKTLGGKMLYLEVPVGKEQTFIDKIKSDPIVTYAEVNHIVEIHPY